MIKKTLGGDRLGSGNKMKVAMHNYERSTHDLGNVFRTTMSPGTLVPFYKKLALNGDTWSIDLSTLVRTAPAMGPLFGSYKLQLDMFTVPIRLYNGVLHNNMTKIGMDMKKVKLPKIRIKSKTQNREKYAIGSFQTSQISTSSLMAYLGMRGLGDAFETVPEGGTASDSFNLTREINVVPFLGYYDIYKNYYANKQEEKGYIITGEEKPVNVNFKTIVYGSQPNAPQSAMETYKGGEISAVWATFNLHYINSPWGSQTYTTVPNTGNNENFAFPLSNHKTMYFLYEGTIDKKNCNIVVAKIGGTSANPTVTYLSIPLDEGQAQYNTWNTYVANNIIEIRPNIGDGNTYIFMGLQFKQTTSYHNSQLKIKTLKLENIDEMRYDILRHTELDETFYINTSDAGQNEPYKSLYTTTQDGYTYNIFKQNGLALKTYQSDIYQNWLSNETIAGAAGINAVSAVNTESGQFTIDALNLANKVYNMLNRIAVSGGTYEDWQEAVYGENALRRAESPIYEGGLSAEIVFEEVVSTCDTQTDEAKDQPLGSLAGKGTITNVKGGKIEIHVKEPSYIIGIASITPRIDYCNGNDFDLTELDSLDDLHKPALDEIGFQDLMSERLAWWGKVWDNDNQQWINQKIGKQPAWIDYMTSVNQVYGEFAEPNSLNCMVLTRNYEFNETNALPVNNITDATTYINPTKFNDTFANSNLDAMNFWVQIGINAISRRKMSAKIMPNL